MAGGPREHYDADTFCGWLLLVHQLPSRPAYLRVKIWRQLREAGAIVLRNSGYLLPSTESGLVMMRQIVREIERSKGQAALCEPRFIGGVTDTALQEFFNQARDAEYAALEADLRSLESARKGRRNGDGKIKLEKLSQRYHDISLRDFFFASGRKNVLALLAGLEHRPISRAQVVAGAIPSPVGKVWVTRKDIHVDRIACAWLIRRFVDPQAQFKFVGEKAYRPAAGELRFDMKDAEFTHEDDLCSFEVILKRLGLADPGLAAIGEIIHDLDIRDGKYERPETLSIGQAIDDICMTQHDDMARIERGGSLLDDAFQRSRNP